MNNPLNWTVAHLREKLTELGINVSKGFSAATLRQLYKENVKNNNVTVERKNPIVPSVLSRNDVTNQNNVLLQTIVQSCAALQQTVNTM